MGYIFSTDYIQRCSDNTYFFSHVDHPTSVRKLGSVLATLKRQKRNINLMAIAIASQKSGMALLKKRLKHVFQCKNPRTGRVLHLFYKHIAAPTVKTPTKPKLVKKKPTILAAPTRVRRLKHENL
jgi:hypothetical protein